MTYSISIILIVASVGLFVWIRYRPSKEQRIHNRFKRETRKLVFKQYNGIVTMCESIAKAWSAERIPLESVNEMIDNAQIINTENDPVVVDRVEKFNETLRIFKNVLKMRSMETMKDGKISIPEIKHFVEKFKSSFIEGQNSDTLKKEEDGNR